jgi:DNA-3-methyladenine glycosylase I
VTRRLAAGLARGEDGVVRCAWCGSDPLYVAYHDREWGRPVRDERRLFEKLCLEGFQAGLSWLTILRKRERFRAAFAGFDAAELSRFGAADVRRLLKDAGIVRHRGKIESTINNAKRVLALKKQGGSLARLVWSYQPASETRPAKIDWATLETLSKTPESTALSRELRRRGFSFVGPTTVYAFMQAMGLVNDHVVGCEVREDAERERRRLRGGAR